MLEDEKLGDRQSEGREVVWRTPREERASTWGSDVARWVRAHKPHRAGNALVRRAVRERYERGPACQAPSPADSPLRSLSLTFPARHPVMLSTTAAPETPFFSMVANASTVAMSDGTETSGRGAVAVLDSGTRPACRSR